MNFKYFSTFLLCLLVWRVNSLPTSLELYSPVDGFPCVTLLNKDGTIGCTTPRDGEFGALWPLNSNAEIEEWLRHLPSDKKTIVLPNSVFTKDNVDRLAKCGKVAGILVAANGAGPEAGFSPVEKYPNKAYGLFNDVDYEWNPLGDGFAYQRYHIPIWSLNGNRPNPYPGDSSTNILEKAESNRQKNGAWPQWAARMNSFMIGGTNAETCLRRGRCDPIGGKSVWSSFDPIDQNKNIVMAISPIDSNAFFHDLAVGGNAEMSGTIALILAAQALAPYFRKADIGQFPKFEKQIVFGFFTGEAWGYIGSKRFVYDIQHFQCKQETNGKCDDPPTSTLAFQNIKLEKISQIVELNQVGNFGLKNNSRTLMYYHYERSNTSPEMQSLLQAIDQVNDQLPVWISKASFTTPGLPPSSVMSFIKDKPKQAGVVLSEYDTAYTNKYFHSRFDTNVSLSSICSAAAVMAQLLYNLAKNVSAPNDLTFPINCTNDSFAHKLTYCLTKDIGCPLARDYFNADDSDYETQPTQYTGVFRIRSILSSSAIFIYNAVVEAMGYTGENPIGCKTSKDCGGRSCINGQCYFSETYWHHALSLAFSLDSPPKIVPEYWETESTWTESRWNTPYMEVFLLDNPSVEIAAFVLGLVQTIGSLIGVWFLKKYILKTFKGQ